VLSTHTLASWNIACSSYLGRVAAMSQSLSLISHV
jgi:hypothetical protein